MVQVANSSSSPQESRVGYNKDLIGSESNS